MTDPGSTKILLVSGSLRAESVNRAVLRTAASVAGPSVIATLYEGMGELPHFNPDDDPDGGPVARPVSDLRNLLADADAVLFCTPEYAGSLPGSFKNLLDWTVGGGETYGKPVAWINASSRLNPEAGSGAHETLRTVLGYTGTDVVAAACRRIQVPRSAVDADGVIGDGAIREEIANAVRTLAGHAGGKLSLRSARLDERVALEDLQRRSSMHEPMYRNQLAAHPDAIELPVAHIRDGLVRVVEQNGVVLGFSVLLEPVAGSSELDGLFVEPDRMRSGVGRRLIDDAKRIARERGATRIEVVANPQALAFYRSVGFRAVGEATTRFGPAPRMSLPLDR